VSPAAAQQIGKGVLLVAARDLPDPNFAETVVLLTHYDAKAAMGLILNRPARLPVTALLKEWKSAQTHAETVYAGGPVERGAILALLKAAVAPDGAAPVLQNIHLLRTRDSLDAALANGNGPSTLRLYLGYAGWGEGQLDREVRMGAWRLERATPDLVFAKDVPSLWRRLMDRSESTLARLTTP
jgi:putative transcriptional regulator